MDESATVSGTTTVGGKSDPPAEAVTGDINTDGTCDKADLALLHQFLLASGDLTETQAAAADLNADGRINAADMTLLKRLLLHQ